MAGERRGRFVQELLEVRAEIQAEMERDRFPDEEIGKFIEEFCRAARREYDRICPRVVRYGVLRDRLS